MAQESIVSSFMRSALTIVMQMAAYYDWPLPLSPSASSVTVSTAPLQISPLQWKAPSLTHLMI